MRTKIIESELPPYWLKVMIAVLDPEEINHPSHLPYNAQHVPGVPLIKLERKTRPNDVWILDLSTREGAAFSLGAHIDHQFSKANSNL